MTQVVLHYANTFEIYTFTNVFYRRTEVFIFY